MDTLQLAIGLALLTVAHGPGEPRSVGSYALRLYAPPHDPGFPLDDFADGTVRPRDGAVESLLAADVDGDGRADAVVVVRSAGSGGYLSADAFAIAGGRLEIIRSVEGLDGGADPVSALRDAP